MTVTGLRVIMLGPPGAGKGTQALRLVEKLKIANISTGEMLRNEIRPGTAIGRKASEFIEKGLLVPDEVVVQIVRDRISRDDCRAGYVLDGFPRTVVQAEALDQVGVEVNHAALISVDEEKLVRRITGRRTCPSCGRVWHVDFDPCADGVHCDVCTDVELIIRKDDCEETVRRRLVEYHAKTVPVAEYYRSKGLLRVVDGNGPIDVVFCRLLEALGFVCESEE